MRMRHPRELPPQPVTRTIAGTTPTPERSHLRLALQQNRAVFSCPRSCLPAVRQGRMNYAACGSIEKQWHLKHWSCFELVNDVVTVRPEHFVQRSL